MLYMKRNHITIALLTAAAGFTACEDVIDLEVPNGKTYTVVDAWITDVPGSNRSASRRPSLTPAPPPRLW